MKRTVFSMGNKEENIKQFLTLLKSKQMISFQACWSGKNIEDKNIKSQNNIFIDITTTF